MSAEWARDEACHNHSRAGAMITSGLLPYKTGGKRMVCTRVSLPMRSIECSIDVSGKYYIHIFPVDARSYGEI